MRSSLSVNQGVVTSTYENRIRGRCSNSYFLLRHYVLPPKATRKNSEPAPLAFVLMQHSVLFRNQHFPFKAIPSYESPGPVAYLPIWGWAGPHYWTFLAFFIGTAILGHSILLFRWFRVRGEEQARLALFLVASLAAYVGGCPEFALKYGVRLGWLNPFGLYGLPLHIALITYAIIRHRFLNINIVIRRSIVYSMLVTLLTVGYFGLIYGAERIFQTTFGYQSIWFSLAAFATMALAFQPLKLGIQRLVDWLLLRMRHEDLVKRLERLEQETRQTEKLKSVAALAAGLCHELRSPLQVIQTHVEVLPDHYDEPGFRKRCTETMRAEIIRINDLLKQLMDFAKPKQPLFRPIEPHEILDSTLGLLSNEFVKRRIHLEKYYGANGTTIRADSDQMRQVILNLVLNALQAIDKDGAVTVSTRQENGYFVLDIKDSGPGFDPRIAPKLFEPFNSSKQGGTGLGLSMVHSIVKEHGGKISAESKPGQGTVFSVKLPSG